jgi:hypothetical protein
MVLPEGPQTTTKYEAESLRFARWITKATNTLRIRNYVLLFHCNSGYKNTTSFYVIRIFACLDITEGCVYCAVQAESSNIFSFQCHHMSFVGFVVLPPGHGRNVTDF